VATCFDGRVADDKTPLMPADGGILLFSYGTLQQSDVQLATFGRHLGGERDAVVAHELDWVTIVDPHVIATSGSDRHPVLVASDRPDSSVDGTVFTITAAELAAADEYEVDDYTRVLVPLRSGRRAWMYTLAGTANGKQA
jgi:gamma-glutamylcyclotransferase (GGCT)/AIG2-like uncharacterized protein YtfP